MRATLDARTGIEVCRNAAWALKNERSHARLDFSGPSESLTGAAEELHEPGCRKRQVLRMDYTDCAVAIQFSPPIRLLTAAWLSRLLASRATQDATRKR